jgi:hypothetical protein
MGSLAAHAVLPNRLVTSITRQACFNMEISLTLPQHVASQNAIVSAISPPRG